MYTSPDYLIVVVSHRTPRHGTAGSHQTIKSATQQLGSMTRFERSSAIFLHLECGTSVLPRRVPTHAAQTPSTRTQQGLRVYRHQASHARGQGRFASALSGSTVAFLSLLSRLLCFLAIDNAHIKKIRRQSFPFRVNNLCGLHFTRVVRHAVQFHRSSAHAFHDFVGLSFRGHLPIYNYTVCCGGRDSVQNIEWIFRRKDWYSSCSGCSSSKIFRATGCCFWGARGDASKACLKRVRPTTTAYGARLLNRVEPPSSFDTAHQG